MVSPRSTSGFPRKAQFRCAFKIEQPAPYHVWGRIGYELARSTFEWRIDDGAWNKITPDNVTTDLTELSFFTEVAWRRFGQVKLLAGDHTLEIRIPKPVNARGEAGRFLFGVDAFCLTPDEFRANGKFPPGQDGHDDGDRQAEKVVYTLPAINFPSIARSAWTTIARSRRERCRKRRSPGRGPMRGPLSRPWPS